MLGKYLMQQRKLADSQQPCWSRRRCASLPARCLVLSGEAMRRRSKAGGEPAKAQRRKTGARKSRIAPKACAAVHPLPARKQRSCGSLASGTRPFSGKRRPPRCSRSSAARHSIYRRFSTPSSSSAARLCEADKGAILRPTGEDASFYMAASYRHTPEFFESQKGLSLAPGRYSVVGRVLLENKSVQIQDVLS